MFDMVEKAMREQGMVIMILQNNVETPAIGPISEGTVNLADLIPRLYRTLEQYAPSRAVQVRTNYEYLFDAPQGWPRLLTEATDDCTNLYETLFDELDEIAPKGCYFGAHESDGASIGWWKYD